MAFKNIKSSDPRKREMVDILRCASGGSKITMLHADERGVFFGHVLQSTGDRGYESLGWFAILADGSSRHFATQDPNGNWFDLRQVKAALRS